MRILLVLLTLVLGACSPSPISIGPDITPNPLGDNGPVLTIPGVKAVTIPLTYHATSAWEVSPTFGVATRDGCGKPELDLHPLAIEIDAGSVPNGSKIVGATLVIDPCDDRGEWLPDNLPMFGLFAVDRWGIATQLVNGAQDPSLNVAEYSAPHELVMPKFSAPIHVSREKNRYMVLFEPEYGDEAVGGMRVTGLVLDVSVP